jgi:osmotically-inducible protein OsmY
MRRTILIVCQLVLLAVFSLNAQADASLAKSDGEIQQCISDRLAASPSLKDQGLSASVSNGVATLTGTARNPGSKGAVTRIARKCGAATVTNNITISASYKPAKKSAGEKKM